MLRLSHAAACRPGLHPTPAHPTPAPSLPCCLQVFDQVDLDNHYSLWPYDKLEYSAVGLDVG